MTIHFQTNSIITTNETISQLSVSVWRGTTSVQIGYKLNDNSRPESLKACLYEGDVLGNRDSYKKKKGVHTHEQFSYKYTSSKEKSYK